MVKGRFIIPLSLYPSRAEDITRGDYIVVFKLMNNTHRKYYFIKMIDNPFA